MPPESLKSHEINVLTTEEILFKTGCVELDFDKPVTFSSGIKSPIRINCARLGGLYRSEVFARLKTLVQSTFFDSDFDFFCGVIRGGVPLAVWLSSRFEKSSIQRLGKNQSQERKRLVKGKINPNSSGLIVEDVVTTGENLIICAEQIRSESGRVLGAISIFNYGFNLLDVNLFYYGISRSLFFSLTSFPELVATGLKRRRFKQTEAEKLRDWWAKTEQFLSKPPKLAKITTV